MLVRLFVRGFKSLYESEVFFGPFTCVAGPNGVGKSNLFDAILFLSDLSSLSLIEAAARVRDPLGRSGDIAQIFSRTSGRRKSVYIEADILVPTEIVDDFGSKVKPSASFLRYIIEMEYEHKGHGHERIKLIKEELSYIPKDEAKLGMGFSYENKFFRSVVFGKKFTKYISTEEGDQGNIIVLHQDGMQGRPYKIPAESSPRTMLSSINTASHATVLSAKREMQSWLLLQLEPSSLRQPDSFNDEAKVSSSGAHMPNTLLRLNKNYEIENELADILPDIKCIEVDKDDGRRLNTILVKSKDNISYPARSLSDGTLRYLALSIISADPQSGRMICFEEPENGIHPSRVHRIIKLLRGMTVDTSYAVDDDNPLRQVIINTHSPIVVADLSVDELLLAKAVSRGNFLYTDFFHLHGSVRSEIMKSGQNKSVGRGEIQKYLKLIGYDQLDKNPLRNSVADFAFQQELDF